MTDKRFTITDDFEEHQYQIRDNGKILMGCFVKPQAEPIVALLNEQHEQIQELIQSSKELEEDCQSTFNAMSRKQDDLYRKNFKLKEETEKLKQELEDCRDANTRCCNEYSFFHKEMMKAEKETQRIKTLLHQAYEQERTKLGKSVLRQVIEMIE